MLWFEPVRSGRARTCWGLDLGEGPLQDRTAHLYDLDADTFIFPLVNVNLADETAHEIVLEHCAEALASAVSHHWDAAKQSTRRARIAHHLTAMPLDEAMKLGQAIHDDWYADSRFALLLARVWPDRGKHDIWDLEDIDVLDGLVNTLKRRRAIPFDALDLTRIAFYAALNPTGLCPESFALGELFTVSGWLGILHRGRSVVMPRFIAAYWTMVMQGAKDPSRSTWAPDLFLLEWAERVIGLGDLEQACARVLSSGPIRLVRRTKIVRRRSLSRISHAPAYGVEPLSN